MSIKKIFRSLLIIAIIINISSVCFADDIDEEQQEKNYILNELIKENNQTINSSNIKVDKPTINSRKYTIFDRNSGLSIYNKDENKQTSMASTTKIMTRYSCTRKLFKSI